MENKQKSIKWNIIMNAILTMSSFVFPLITFPYVARIILPVGIGKVTFATSVVTYFSMFAQLGIPTYGIRACARVRDDKNELSRIVHELLIINLIMSIAAYAIFEILMFAIPRFREDKTLFMIMSITILLNALGVEWLYKALEQYSYITIRSIIFKIIALVCVFFGVKDKNDYIVYGAITILAASASNILNFINLRKKIYIHPIGNYNIKRHIKMIMVFFSMSVATTIYTNLDNVMLGFMRDDIQVGYYSAAVKIKMILISFVTSASTVLLPRASYYVDKGYKDEFYNILKKTMHFIFVVAIPFVVYFVIYAKESIYFISGKDYEGAIVPMQIIMPTVLLIGITNVTGIQMLVPLGREKQVLYSEIVGAIVDLVLNLVLIPEFGAAGAAVGTLLAEVAVLLYQCVAIRDIPISMFKDIPYIRIGLSAIVGMIFSIWVKKLEVTVFTTLVLSGICFFCVYGAMLMFTKDLLVQELKQQFFNKLKRK